MGLGVVEIHSGQPDSGSCPFRELLGLSSLVVLDFLDPALGLGDSCLLGLCLAAAALAVTFELKESPSWFCVCPLGADHGGVPKPTGVAGHGTHQVCSAAARVVVVVSSR